METLPTTSKSHQILHHPIIKIILGLVVCFIAFILAQSLAGKLLELANTPRAPRNLIKALCSASAVLYTYTFFFTRIEKRKINELSNKNLEWNLVIGLAVGTTLQLLTLAVIYLLGNISILAINQPSSLIIPFAVALTVAIFEEVLMRGIIFRITQEKLGSYIALAVSAILFGALHLFNPGASLISTICVTTAGLLFGAAYMYAKNLWLPIAIHFAWNFVQSGIFGATSSGNENTTSLFKLNITGNPLLTGGSFGPEASLHATVFCGTAALIFMYMNRRSTKFILFSQEQKKQVINPKTKTN